MLLKRFAYPCWLSDIIHRIGRVVPELQPIFRRGFKITITARLRSGIISFLAETTLRFTGKRGGRCLTASVSWMVPCGLLICRPGENQTIVYNGHKRVHAVKFKSVTLPNGLGLVAHLYGPVGKFY
ncbi:unnamed protein product [Porites lobata]|uniref:DUF4166 domain-containing protein n=1 Tax=Porites lobata TaxID=104759 RepID=A0ABN8SFX7_9CNID|nr:unnamed protein product [Porites lobata]